MTSREEWEDFLDRLRLRFRLDYGIDLSCEALGQTSAGLYMWSFNYNKNGLVTLQCHLHHGTEPYSSNALDQIVETFEETRNEESPST